MFAFISRQFGNKDQSPEQRPTIRFRRFDSLSQEAGAHFGSLGAAFYRSLGDPRAQPPSVKKRQRDDLAAAVNQP